jgi:hypothetical protein
MDSRAFFLSWLAGAVILASCGTSNVNPPFDGTSDADAPGTDSDGDTILDTDEGRFDSGGQRDTDGDTLPDFQDTDSDADGIPDAVEAGDDDYGTPPRDSDGDGIPDFMETDSDDNGILDPGEGTSDTDGDGLPDFADPDNDGDGISDKIEINGNPASPEDTDSDGIPDYMDIDSDNDTIRDMDERNVDTDEDGMPNYRDQDSDGDGIPDRDEAGDEELSTPPVDTDEDRVPDFLDRDSDSDGLSDAWEAENGTDPTKDDTDGDGTSDLIEVGAGTDPLDFTNNPRTEGNFVFIMPFNEEPIPPQDTLVFTTDIQKADVYFLIDTSGSMSDEVFNLRDSLRDTVVPGIGAEIPDVWFGLMRFDDCPWDCGDTSIKNVCNLTGDIGTVQTALNSITDWCGGWEPYTMALYITASGDPGPLAPRTCSDPAAMIGYPCFRDGSIPILVMLGDEAFYEGIDYCSPSKSVAEAVAAINGISGKYIGVNSGDSRPDMVTVATGTGSVDIGGNPLVFNVPSNGTGLGAQVVDAVALLANQVPIEVSTARRDDPVDGICMTSSLERVPCCCTDAGGAPVDCFDLGRTTMAPCAGGDMLEPVDASVEFIEKIVPNTVGGVADPANPTIVCVGGLETADRTGDGIPDVFTAVLPGTPVCFDIYALMNDIVEPLEIPQTFLCEIDVVGDGITVLSTRKVYFLVPPEPIIDVPG